MSEINIPDYLPAWIKEHILLYLKDGEAGHLWDSSSPGGKGIYTTLLLTTTGRKSGKKRILPLIYQPTGDGGYCIIGSKGGYASHPAWFLNLQAQPNVDVQVANDKFKAVARVAEGEERTRLWEKMVSHFPPYKKYKAATDREIPVVVLERT